MSSDTDFEGLPIAANESPDKVVRIWEVDPHPQGDADVLWCRSWQDMLDMVGENLDHMLEDRTADELVEEPFVLKFRILEMKLSEYAGMVANHGEQ